MNDKLDPNLVHRMSEATIAQVADPTFSITFSTSDNRTVQNWNEEVAGLVVLYNIANIFVAIATRNAIHKLLADPKVIKIDASMPQTGSWYET